MNLKKFPGIEQKGAVGRTLDDRGQDIGDASFHREAMGFSDETEQLSLAKLREIVITQQEAWVMRTRVDHPDAVASVIERLIEQYPNHLRRSVWESWLKKD